MNAVLLGVAGYIAVQLAIGAWVARRIRTEEDYLIAGRSLGYPLGIFTIFATWFGAETCIGAAGAIYERGLSGGSADPFGYGLCIILMGAVLAVPLWNRQLTTLGDLFRQRFSAGVERYAVILMIPTSLLWAAAQIRAFGQVLSASSLLPVDVTITMAACVVILYTVWGGMLADAITDLIQGVALIVGLAILLGVVLLTDGPSALASVPPERLELFGGGQVPLLEILESWAIPVFGSLVAAELVQRVISTRSPVVARRATLSAGGLYLMVGIVPVAIGLIGFQVLPGLEHPEQILPLLALERLPPLLYVFFAGALVSAILSTVDSALLVSASLLSHNVILPIRGTMSEAAKVRTARVAVVAFGVLAYIMAMYAEGVYALVEQASAFGSAGIVVTVLFGLFWTRGGALSAHGALTTGVLVWVLGSYVLGLPYAYLTALASSMLVYVALTWAASGPDRALSGSRA